MHLFPKDFPAYIWMLWDTLTLEEKVYVHLSISQGHLLIRVKETPAVWKQAAQMLMIPLCHEVRPRPSCVRVYRKDLWKVRSHSTSPSDTWGRGLVCHLSVTPRSWKLEGRDSHHPVSVWREILNICKEYEIRCNREREGWLPMDLLEGCALSLPQGRRRLLGTPCALGCACCVLPYKQTQLAIFYLLQQ